MSSNFYEENHFFRGDRRLSRTDVELARLYGPILKQIKSKDSPTPFKDFIKITRRAYSSRNYSLLRARPINTGRRFECFRIYLKFHQLPDLSAWVTSLSGENSESYKKDFIPIMERSKVQLVEWDNYIPDPGRSHIRYHEFFDSLEKTALNYRGPDPADALIDTLSKLRIKFHAQDNKDKLDLLSNKGWFLFLTPYARQLIDFIKPQVLYQDIAEEAFREIIPGYKNL